MDSKVQSFSPDNTDARASFRKPSNDTANRKYRRRSPVSGSSASDESPNHERNSSPISSKENLVRVSDRRHSKDDGRDLDRDSGRNQYGRSGDSHRLSDRQFSRSTYHYHRRDDYSRHEKHADEEERNYSKPSSRSGRDSRGGDHTDYTRRESEYNRTGDRSRSIDKYSRDKSDSSGHRSWDKERETSSREYLKHKDKDSSSDRVESGKRHTNLNFEDIKSGGRDRRMGYGDEKRDYRRSLGDHEGGHSPSYRESKGCRNDSTSQRSSSGRRPRDVFKGDELEEIKKYENRETNRHKEQYEREPGEHFEDKDVFNSGNQQSAAKKPKFNSETITDYGKVSKFTTVADEKQSSSSKQAQGLVSDVASDQTNVKGFEASNDLDAAKVAAMKAAELVNRNLIGTGYLSTDQKKKLLWGSKKSTTTEQSGHLWDTAMFSDRDRQEKFNKLMGLKGDTKMEQKPNSQDGSALRRVEKQKELQLDLEKQYTAGLRRRDGRTVGLGL